MVFIQLHNSMYNKTPLDIHNMLAIYKFKNIKLRVFDLISHNIFNESKTIYYYSILLYYGLFFKSIVIDIYNLYLTK